MMLSRSIWLFLPVLAWAQEAPVAAPREVDQALRARVSEFYQHHVDGTFLKAFETLVADESKGFYFANFKQPYLSYQIDKIDYADNFIKAHVILTTELIWAGRLQNLKVKREAYSDWKIEKGNWYWYYVPEKINPTPMGESDPTAIVRLPDGSIQLPKDLSPEAIKNVGQTLLRATKLDKSEVILTPDKPSEDKVVLHNGAQGWINVTLDQGPHVAGLSFTLDKTQVEPTGDATLKVAFQPRTTRPPDSVRVRLTVEPLNQIFEVTVRLGDAAK